LPSCTTPKIYQICGSQFEMYDLHRFVHKVTLSSCTTPQIYPICGSQFQINKFA
jgi:hypothetical protein